MKFTINNNLRLLTCPLLLAGAVCCSSGNEIGRASCRERV